MKAPLLKNYRLEVWREYKNQRWRKNFLEASPSPERSEITHARLQVRLMTPALVEARNVYEKPLIHPIDAHHSILTIAPSPTFNNQIDIAFRTFDLISYSAL